MNDEVPYQLTAEEKRTAIENAKALRKRLIAKELWREQIARALGQWYRRETHSEQLAIADAVLAVPASADALALRERVEAMAESQYRKAWDEWTASVDAGKPSRLLWARVNQALDDKHAIEAALDGDPANLDGIRK